MQSSADHSRLKQAGLWMGPIVALCYVYNCSMARLDATQRMDRGWSRSLDGDLVVHRGHPGGSNSVYPVSKFPLLQVMPVKAVAQSYAHPTIFLFLGAFLLALSVEKWALHRRIALNVLLRTGTDGRKLILGFMVAGALSCPCG